MAGAAALFASTVLANVVIDPERVFGLGVFPPTPNANERNRKLELYKGDPRNIDALMFSSSRGNFFDFATLPQKMGASNLMSLSVSYGMISDHLPIMEYILRDKAARGQRIKSVLLLLDADFFGKPPWTNSNINSFLPPELSGEPASRYWWRYLTVFQFRLWRDVIRHARAAPPAPAATLITAPPVAATAPAPTQIAAPAAIDPARENAPLPLTPPRLSNYRRSFNSTRPDLERQLKQFDRFAALCRDYNVQLTVVITPMFRDNLEQHEPGVIEGIVDRLSRSAPVWDFTSSPIAGQRAYWEDFSHFGHRAAAMIIDRTYGGQNPMPGFGTLKGAQGSSR
jgi:hypothetical protein